MDGRRRKECDLLDACAKEEFSVVGDGVLAFFDFCLEERGKAECPG
jgi:hypothetical protein